MYIEINNYIKYKNNHFKFYKIKRSYKKQKSKLTNFYYT